MSFQKTILITDSTQLITNPPQRGQWIKLAWCEKPSRFHSSTQTHITAFHYPNAVTLFNAYCKPLKGAKS